MRDEYDFSGARPYSELREKMLAWRRVIALPRHSDPTVAALQNSVLLLHEDMRKLSRRNTELMLAMLGVKDRLAELKQRLEEIR